MKNQFAFIILAALSISALAQAKEVTIDSRQTEALYLNLSQHGAITVETGSSFDMGYKKIALGDIACTRTPNRRLESATPFYYSCTKHVADTYLPAYDEAKPERASNSRRAQ